jgi:hypothetical protein
MLKFAKRHPILLGCAVIAIVSVAVMVFFTTQSPIALLALLAFAAACFIAEVILNYKVFGAGSNSTIYRPGANRDDHRR